MNQTQLPNLSDRLKASADAKKALIAKFQPKAAATDPDFDQRPAMRAAELDRVREDRATAKAAKKQAIEQAAQDAIQAVVMTEQAELDAKRSERKERKALTKAEAKTKRDARYAARKARQNGPRGMASYAA